MWKKQVSPRTLKAAEKYIASVGRKREELTEEQWNLMVNYVKTRRLGLPLLIFCGLICAVFTLVFYHLGQGFVEELLPHQVVKISFDDQRESISISPEEMRRHLSYATECYMLAGMQFMLALDFLIFVFGGLTIVWKQNRKTHMVLLSRPTSTESVL